jgi:flagellar basal-body rod protein FlgC
MAFLSSMNVVGSGLTAQQLRLDVVSENITNRTTTRTEGGGAYRRKMVVFEAEGERSPFQAALDRALGRGASGTAGGVRVTEIVEDRIQTELKPLHFRSILFTAARALPPDPPHRRMPHSPLGSGIG